MQSMLTCILLRGPGAMPAHHLVLRACTLHTASLTHSSAPWQSTKLCLLAQWRWCACAVCMCVLQSRHPGKARLCLLLRQRGGEGRGGGGVCMRMCPERDGVILCSLLYACMHSICMCAICIRYTVYSSACIARAQACMRARRAHTRAGTHARGTLHV